MSAGNWTGDGDEEGARRPDRLRGMLGHHPHRAPTQSPSRVAGKAAAQIRQHEGVTGIQWEVTRTSAGVYTADVLLCNSADPEAHA